MNVLIDTNVVIDVLLQRELFYRESLRIFELVEDKKITGFVSASAITDIHFLVKKAVKSDREAQLALRNLTAIFSILTVDEADIIAALALQWNDFEDAVQYTIATDAQMDVIISRDADGYRHSAIPGYSPIDFIHQQADNTD